jgi:acetoin utilization protein AcuB
VKDIMSNEPLTVTESTPIVEAARLMGERHVHGCPVVDVQGVLCGIVTSIDVMKWVGANSARPRSVSARP